MAKSLLTYGVLLFVAVGSLIFAFFPRRPYVYPTERQPTKSTQLVRAAPFEHANPHLNSTEQRRTDSCSRTPDGRLVQRESPLTEPSLMANSNGFGCDSDIEFSVPYSESYGGIMHRG